MGGSSFNIGWGDPTFLFTPEAVGELGQDAAATADGVIPFANPLADAGVYDECDPLHQFSQNMGGLARDLALASAIPNIGTWAKNPVMYEIGSSALPNGLHKAISHLSAIDKGKFLVGMFGPKAALISDYGKAAQLVANGGAAGSGTPGAWLAVLGLGEALNTALDGGCP
jgi:hypothetical protein